MDSNNDVKFITKSQHQAEFNNSDPALNARLNNGSESTSPNSRLCCENDVITSLLASALLARIDNKNDVFNW